MLTYRTVSKAEFLQAFHNARLTSDRIAEATSTVQEIDEATNKHDTFILTNDAGGFIIRNGGELIGLFSVGKGNGDNMVQAAIVFGAEYLDCFDGYLTKLYAKHGFKEVKRELNWTPGGPDVVYMQFK